MRHLVVLVDFSWPRMFVWLISINRLPSCDCLVMDRVDPGISVLAHADLQFVRRVTRKPVQHV